jgi:hypothetical protein
VARRLLRQHSLTIAVLGLGLGSCRHRDPSQTLAPSASASASASADFAEKARAVRYASELKRAADRWQSKPNLDDCTVVLHQDSDPALCHAAAAALAAIEQLDPSLPTERILPVLADGALSLARLSERARYQSLAEIGEKRVTGSASAAPATSGSKAAPAKLTPPKPAAASPSSSSGLVPQQEQHALELGDSPVGKFLPVVLRLERDALRNLGAYLEYAPLDVRRAALDTVKRLRDTHPQWALLDNLVREAWLLEPDPEQKRLLKELVGSGLPRGKSPAQSAVHSTDSK